MKKVLIIMMVIAPFFLNAQKFRVICDDDRIVDRIGKKISNLGFVVVDEPDKADFTVEVVYQTNKGYLSAKKGFHKTGYIRFLNNRDSILTRTGEQGGRAWGYNMYTALSTLINKILETDFDSIIKNVAASYKPVQEQTTGNAQTPSKADELIKLKKLLDDGILTQDEFEKEKKKLLDQ